MAKGKKSKNSKSGKKTQKPHSAMNQIESPASCANQQLNTKLMQLPQEIRDEIYANIFGSTRFVFGKRTFGRIDRRRIVSSARGTALAILRTCHRIRDEIGVSWLHQVSFHFEEPEALLSKLNGVPVIVRSQIRHVRVSGHPLMISWEDQDVYYRTAQALKLVPGLELDTLTVLGCKGAQVSYDALDMLIRYSDGWKELRYISHTSELLGYKEPSSPFGLQILLNRDLRQPQPADWQRALEQRDGKAAHPSVVIYRATKASTPGAVLQPLTRIPITQVISADQDAQTFGLVEDATLTKPGEINKEILVVVKRGAGVEYAEKEGSPFLPVGDIREDRPGKIWKDIKAERDAWIDQDEDFDDDDDEEYREWVRERYEKPAIVDSYRNVDEYTWPPLHFLKD